jgi:hypothetical protein
MNDRSVGTGDCLRETASRYGDGLIAGHDELGVAWLDAVSRAIFVMKAGPAVRVGDREVPEGEKRGRY